MKLERLYHSTMMLLLRTRGRRTAYLKKHNILGGMGEQCEWVPWLIPLYPKLIKLHDNVHIHKTAKLIPHDVLNGFLRKARPDEDFGAYERLGCIEIMDNVYVAMNAVILPNVRIGRDCIITAGSVVSSDVPDNSIVAGNPAKVIGTFDMYVASRKMIKGQSIAFKNQVLPQDIVDEQWKQFEEKRKDSTSKGDNSPQTVKSSTVQNNAFDGSGDLEQEIISLLSEELPDVDFSEEDQLVEKGILDSVALTVIIAELEDKFQCSIPVEAVNGQNFNSVKRIAALIKDLSE